MMQRYKLDISLVMFSTIALAFACSDDTLDFAADDLSERAGKNTDTTGKGGGKGKGGPNAGDDGGAAGDGDAIAVTTCSGKVYACGDAVDNDGDGLTDYQDPECTTPCDNDENSFQTDLPGQNEDCKSDCFFDENTGAGDDLCDWDLRCDPENPGALIGCEYDADPACPPLPAVQSDACLAACLPLVPNGCDCFGCCELGKEYVYLDGSPDCRLGNLEACQSCTFNEECANPCDTQGCELCFGQTPDELPQKCDGQPACPDGVTACVGHEDCPADYFCQTGCCTPIG